MIVIFTYTLIAFERIVMSTKSFLIGLGVIERHLNIDEAAKAAQVEVQAQILRWGEVEDCMFKY